MKTFIRIAFAVINLGLISSVQAQTLTHGMPTRAQQTQFQGGSG